MKKLKCIKKNEWPNGKITIGKIYELDSEVKENFYMMLM
jgi:hypothetical protein